MNRTGFAAIVFGLAFAPAAVAQVKDRAVAVGQAEVVITVTKVDLQKRAVTFRGPQGNVATMTVPAQSQNLDQVKPGAKFKMKYVESVAVEIRKGGKPAAATTTEEVRLAPKGGTPGGVVVRTHHAAGVVDALDLTNRYVAIRGPKGNVGSFKVADDVAIEQLAAGDRIQVVYTEALAMEMIPQAPAKKAAKSEGTKAK